MSTTKFWLNDISILLKKEEMYDFIPSKSMNKVQQLNALVRGSLFLSLLLSFLKNDIRFISIFIIILGLTYLIHIYENSSDN
jgi:predicted component of type VI protein secretion system